MAAAEKAVMASRDVVDYSDLTLLVPDAVSMILVEQKKITHLSADGCTVWLEMPYIIVE